MEIHFVSESFYLLPSTKYENHEAEFKNLETAK